MEQLAELAQSPEYKQLSLRKFCECADIAYWRLRDYLKHQQSRAYRNKCERLEQQQTLVEQIALQNPTYGYRLVHLELNKSHPAGTTVRLPGLHKTRNLMKQQGLQAKVPKKRRKVGVVSPTTLWPVGRRIQMDATQVELSDGTKRWVYSVQDVDTRTCLDLHPTPSLGAPIASKVLEVVIRKLIQQGIISLNHKLLIQTDGGSDFTSGAFQSYCHGIGNWVRCKVNQVGGMGILERMHRTFKYDYLFRHEISHDHELKAVCQGFMVWYNQQRPHSAIGYVTPASLLLKTVA